MKIVWEGFEVALDGDTVRFGDGEHDWLKPTTYPESEAFHHLHDARIDDLGFLWISGDDGAEFVFIHVSTKTVIAGRVIDGYVFNYRWRKVPAESFSH